MIIGRHTKQPVERLDYDIDFSDFLGADSLIANSNDPQNAFPRAEISSTSEANPTLTVESCTIQSNPKFLKVQLSGGTNGVTYKVTVTVLSVNNRIKQTEFIVKVKDQ